MRVLVEGPPDVGGADKQLKGFLALGVPSSFALLLLDLLHALLSVTAVLNTAMQTSCVSLGSYLMPRTTGHTDARTDMKTASRYGTHDHKTANQLTC